MDTSSKSEVKHREPNCLGASGDALANGCLVGLGWGLEPREGTFLPHWGDNGPFTAFTVGSMHDRSALRRLHERRVGPSIMPELVSTLCPATGPSLTWLDYVRHDAARPSSAA